MTPEASCVRIPAGVPVGGKPENLFPLGEKRTRLRGIPVCAQGSSVAA